MELCNLPYHMASAWSCWFVYVCIILCDQKIDQIISALVVKKILLCVLYYLLVEFQCLPSCFLRPATCSCTNIAICACSVKAGSEVLHYGRPKPHLTVMHCATCSSSVSICLHKIITHVHV